MEDFVFVKKGKLYRKVLYFMLIAVIIFQVFLFVLNIFLIRKNSNWFLVVFNMVFLITFAFILYKHILPKYKYKMEKADYKWFKINKEFLIVKYNDNSVIGYNFINEGDSVKSIKFLTKITKSTNSLSDVSYNVLIKLSDGKSISALLPYSKAKELVETIPNKVYVKELKKELDSYSDFYTKNLTKKSKHIPSMICFALSCFTLMFTLIILFGYSSTNGTYYASELVNNNPNMPVNTFSYEVQNVNYTNKEDYTISFGDNLNRDIKVFYRVNNPSDSYSMYTIDFLVFITLTLMVIGGIMLNNVYSPYLAVFGVSLMPFFLVRLLNLNLMSFLSSQLLIPVFSLLSIPVFLFISAILKIGTDVIKNVNEKKLKTESVKN